MSVRKVFRLGAVAAVVIALHLLVRPTLDGSQLFAQEDPTYDPAAIPTPAAMPAATSGRAIYQENCAPCHGATGLSDGPVVGDLPAAPPPFADPESVWLRSPAEYFHTTKFGRVQALMPPWRNQLSDEEIWQVVYYAWSLHTDQTLVADGAQLYAESCAGCHGATGAGDGPEAEGELGDLSDASMVMVRTPADLAAGWTAAHADVGSDWSQAEQRNVLDYMRTFTYLPPWQSAYRAGNGTISGTIVQGTANGPSVGAAPVQLRAFIDFAEVATVQDETDENGRFQFDNLMTDPSAIYLVETTYEEVRYGSEFFEFPAGSTAETVDITVYEQSDDDSGIAIARSNWIIDFQPGQLLLGQVMTLGNQTDSTFAGKQLDGAAQPVTVQVPVPEGAVEIEFADGTLGSEYILVDGTIYDTRPISPGDQTRQIFVSYSMPVDGDSASIIQPFAYDVGLVNLLVAELPDLDVAVDTLEYVENDTIQGVEYRLWNGENIGAGSTISVDLTNVLEEGAIDPRALIAAQDNAAGAAVDVAGSMPSQTAPPLDPTIAWAMGGLLLLTLGGVFVWSLRGPQKMDKKTILANQRAALLNDIAALDDEHALGRMSDVEWTAQRARLKSRLFDIAQQQADPQ